MSEVLGVFESCWVYVSVCAGGVFDHKHDPWSAHQGVSRCALNRPAPSAKTASARWARLLTFDLALGGRLERADGARTCVRWGFQERQRNRLFTEGLSCPLGPLSSPIVLKASVEASTQLNRLLLTRRLRQRKRDLKNFSSLLRSQN